MPEDMSDRVPEDMPDRMPEDLPVRKCINVMVGITRSKVFFSGGFLHLFLGEFITLEGFEWIHRTTEGNSGSPQPLSNEGFC